MQSRRQFLCTAIQNIGGASMTLLLAPLIGCNDDDGLTVVPGPAVTTNPTEPGCDGAGAASTVTLDHNHTVCVPLADIAAPPAAGRSYPTSPASTDGHVHQVVLTQAQLIQLGANQTIVVTTTIIEAHTHDFSLVENGPSAPAPAPAPTPPPGPY